MFNIIVILLSLSFYFIISFLLFDYIQICPCFVKSFNRYKTFQEKEKKLLAFLARPLAVAALGTTSLNLRTLE